MGNEIIGVGGYVPNSIVSNEDLAKTLETTHEWIVERTGIYARHVAGTHEYTSHLGAKAAIAALGNAGVDATQIDLIVLATSTPDESLPSTATRIQAKTGAKNAASFDVNAACGGFVYALHIADCMMRTGNYQNALVIGAETMSRVIDWNDRRTAILFGDGAGAVILQQTQNEGVIDSIIRSDGEYGDLLRTTGGVSKGRIVGNIEMEGREVFRHAVEKMSSVAEELLHKNGLTVADIDWLIPHQANMRILSACGKRLGIAEEKVVATVAKHANTSAASIPLAMAHWNENHKLKKGDLVLLAALGAGFTWGGALIRW
jgi:3-oxoacyl-[acyl-carrier-protein] synthase III